MALAKMSTLSRLIEERKAAQEAAKKKKKPKIAVRKTANTICFSSKTFSHSFKISIPNTTKYHFAILIYITKMILILNYALGGLTVYFLKTLFMY